MSNDMNLARRWVNDDVRRVLEAEIRNEDNGGVRPATLSSTIDSLMQMPDEVFPEDVEITSLLVNLLVIRDLLPGSTRVEELLTPAGPASDDIIRHAALAYLHGDDLSDDAPDLRQLADALGVPHEDVEALG